MPRLTAVIGDGATYLSLRLAPEEVEGSVHVTRHRTLLPVFTSVVLMFGFAAPAAAVAAAGVSPMLEPGPKAVPVAVSGPGYGLFNCQVGLSVGQCYDPYQMRHAYGIDALIADGYTGRGRTITIVDAFQSPNIVAQLNYWDTFYGLPGLNGLGNPYDSSLGTFTQVAPDGLTAFVPGDPNMTGWAEEISLDVLWAHAIAPGANIVLDLAASNDDADILSATKYVVDHRMGDVISQSFGEDESCVDSTLLKQEHQVFAEATLRGITLFASSGDEGAAQSTCDGNSWSKAASSPASDPLVTAVGGTELQAADYCLTTLGCDPTANPEPGTHLGEIAWNEGPPYGDFQPYFDSTIATGGGFSLLFDEPFYQKGAIHGRTKGRGVPDVSYNGAVLHGVLTYLDIPGLGSGMYRFGGTSAGSPQWAAILAITDQKAHHDLGFINRGLYEIGQSKNQYTQAFFDIVSGNNSAEEYDASDTPIDVIGFDAGHGWDATTGLGSPKAAYLVNRLIWSVSPFDGLAAIRDSQQYRFGHWRGRGHHFPH
jgi:subtilase family serine protease